MIGQDSAAVVVERGKLHAGQLRLSLAASLGVALCMAWIAAGQVPAPLLVGWLCPTALALAVTVFAGSAFERAAVADAGGLDRLQQLGAALAGLAWGAAGTLFLPLLAAPQRVALTVVACAGLCAAIVEVGRHGRPFRLQNACCIGQFALAWWHLDDTGTGPVAASLVGFGSLAALASSSVDRLGRQVLAVSVENRRLADSLSVEHARALAADRAKTQFVAAASHDLRQPAAALSLMTNLLREQVADPVLAPLVSGLERSVNSMNDLLGQLLDLSRLDTGHIAVEPRPVDVDALLDELAAELAPRAAERGLWLRVVPCGHTLDCDPVLVARMLRNLADNALRHTREGGITLEAIADRTLSLSVADTGTGITAEHQQRIFEEHYQVGNASRQRSQGLGLGLAIVQRIAALHRVSIHLDSSCGRGSRFTLDFGAAGHRPLTDRRARADPGDREAQPRTGLGAGDGSAGPHPARATLLLVEDDEALALAFLAWLEAAGFLTRHAADGVEALRVLEGGEAPDVVVSDFRLPGEHDGLAVLRFAAQHHPHARLVLVSGDIDPVLAERARAHGVPLLVKPVDPRELQRLLASRPGGAPAIEPAPGPRNRPDRALD